MWQTGDEAAEGKEVVISSASAACKKQSVLKSRWLRGRRCRSFITSVGTEQRQRGDMNLLYIICASSNEACFHACTILKATNICFIN